MDEQNESVLSPVQKSILLKVNEGFILLTHPRRYLHAIKNEEAVVSWVRVLSLAVFFAIMQLIFLPGALNILENMSEGIRAGLFEVVIVFIMVLPYYLIIKISGSPASLRIAVTYVMTTRALLLIPAVVFHGLFLFTEHYAFTIPRGVSLLAYGISLVFILPLSFYDNLKSKMMALLGLILSIGLYTFGWTSLGDILVSKFSRIPEFSILHDPIGQEFDSIAPVLLAKLNQEPTSFTMPGDLLGQVLERKKSGGEAAFLPQEMVSLIIKWKAERDPFILWLDRTNNDLELQGTTLKFDTTKMLVKNKRKEILDQREIVEAMDEYCSKPTAEKVVTLMKLHTKYLTRHNQNMLDITTYLKTRNRCRQWLLID